jgi:hypothetical protein
MRNFTMSCRLMVWIMTLMPMLSAALFPRSAAAQFEELAAKVPSTANAIVLLDAQQIMTSPLAQQEGWKDRYEQAFASGLVTISPDTRHMLLAAQFDYQTMQPLWEVAIADFAEEHSIAEIVRATQGVQDQFGELPAVSLSDDSYCVQLAPMRLGVMSPANRQAVARWLREVGSRNEPGLSAYLNGTLTASKTSQVVVAFDLQDAVPPELIKQKLAASATLKGKKIDLDAASKALSGIRGLVLEVAVTEGSFGRLMVHFNDDASILAPFAKPMILEVLGNLGAMIDDIAEWKVTTEPTKFTLNGTLSEGGRKRVLSLIDHPVAALVATNKGRSMSDSSRPESSKAAYATQTYFKSITKIRDDLREKAKNVKTFGQHALWLDNWARRIDRLPILNVDPEMLAYGRYTTQRMRDASAALKGIGISTAARSAQVYNQYSASGGAYGGYGYGGGYSYNVQYNNVGGQRRAIGAQERAAGATTAQQISAEMDNETAKIRQVMTQKYQIEF